MATRIGGIAILLWASDPDRPELLAVPFLHAAVGAALDVPVEIFFTGGSVRLLVPGVAAASPAASHGSRTVLDLMREALAQGAVLRACTDALASQGIDSASLIAECQDVGGAVQFMARAADPHWRTLVF